MHIGKSNLGENMEILEPDLRLDTEPRLDSLHAVALVEAVKKLHQPTLPLVTFKSVEYCCCYTQSALPGCSHPALI